jgi:hypothetical protein
VVEDVPPELGGPVVPYPERRRVPDGQPGKLLMVLIEVEPGSYLGEDDSIR